MARFDWKAAIEARATEVEALMWTDKNPMFADSLGHGARMKEADRAASFAAWIARSYCRKGRKP